MEIINTYAKYGLFILVIHIFSYFITTLIFECISSDQIMEFRNDREKNIDHDSFYSCIIGPIIEEIIFSLPITLVGVNKIFYIFCGFLSITLIIIKFKYIYILIVISNIISELYYKNNYIRDLNIILTVLCFSYAHSTDNSVFKILYCILFHAPSYLLTLKMSDIITQKYNKYCGIIFTFYVHIFVNTIIIYCSKTIFIILLITIYSILTFEIYN